MFAIPAAQAGTVITAAEWAMPRNGASLVRMPQLQHSVNLLLEQPGSRLELRYPGGDAGVVWAQELRAWLVALGVSSSQIELVPGSSGEDVIELEVRAGGTARASVWTSPVQ